MTRRAFGGGTIVGALGLVAATSACGRGTNATPSTPVAESNANAAAPASTSPPSSTNDATNAPDPAASQAPAPEEICRKMEAFDLAKTPSKPTSPKDHYKCVKDLSGMKAQDPAAYACVSKCLEIRESDLAQQCAITCLVNSKWFEAEMKKDKAKSGGP
jgi:hypothetical protein